MFSSSEFKILSILCLWRVLSVFVVQTAHVPDEYWQSLEVAHRIIFGYGYLTWEWYMKIRSYLYPFLISILYRALAVFGLDNSRTLTILPRLVQALVSGYSDYAFYKWTKDKWMLLSLCVNWYWYYCASRTLINTLETACTILALSIFPWKDNYIESTKFFWIVGLLTMVRPTAAIIWFPMCIYHYCTSLENKLVLGCKYIAISITCLLISTLIDSYFYGTFVISSWEFFRVNILLKVNESYGTEHILWYFFSGLPVLLGVQYIIFIFAIYQIFRHFQHFHRQAVLLFVIAWTVGIYSLLPHKEFRFLLPILPMIIYINGSCIARLNIRCGKASQRIFIVLLLASNIFPGLYFSLVHQRGSLDVMKVLEKEFVDTNATSSNILFLTPCHTTPLYSHLHIDVPIRFLTCEPNINKVPHYIDENDQFFMQPMQWLTQNYINNTSLTLPSHIVIYDSTVPEVTDFLKKYDLLATVFHAHFPPYNYGKYIRVYKYIPLD